MKKLKNVPCKSKNWFKKDNDGVKNYHWLIVVGIGVFILLAEKGCQIVGL